MPAARTPRRRVRPAAGPELLEARTLLTTLVIDASYDQNVNLGSGDLEDVNLVRVAGNADLDSLRFDPAAGGVTVQIDGGARIGAFAFNGGDGRDAVVFARSSATTVGSFEFRGGGGHDAVEFGGVGVGGNVSLDLGDGNDRVAGLGFSGRDLFVSGGSGRDHLSSLFSQGDLRVDAGDGNDVLSSVTAEGRVELILGEGNDVVRNVTSRGRGVRIDGGAGHDAVARVEANASDVDVDLGEGNDRLGHLFGAFLNVRLGAGNDRLDAYFYAAGDGFVSTGEGDDYVCIGVNLGGNMNFQADAGNDSVLFAWATVRGDEQVSLGSGRDVLRVGRGTVHGSSRVRFDGTGTYANYRGNRTVVGDRSIEAGGTLRASFGRDRVKGNQSIRADGDLNLRMKGADVRGNFHLYSCGAAAVTFCGTVGGDADFRGGRGADDFRLSGVKVGGDFVLTTLGAADRVSLRNVTVGRAATFETGSHNDRIALDRVRVGRGLTVRTGGGHDRVKATRLSLTDDVFVELGSGNDRWDGDRLDTRRGKVLLEGNGGRDRVTAKVRGKVRSA